MTEKSDIIRVAVAQSSPVFLDRDGSLEKAVKLIGDAAAQGALLVVFGEAWLPGYPVHAWSAAKSEPWWELAAAYVDQAVDFQGETVDALCSAAMAADIDVVIGLAERDEKTRGSVYSTLAFIDRQGQVISRHRKLRPSAYERVVWSDGDALGLEVHDRGYANLSGLISCEHQMVLPTYALAQHGTQLHAACWPGHLRKPGNGASLWPDQHLLSRAFAAQTGAYVLCAGTTLSRDSVPEQYREFLTHEFTGGSAVIDPRGEVIAGPVEGENLLLADCSMVQVRAAKVAFDCAGHSARPDQLGLQNYAQGDPPQEQPPMDQPPGGFDQPYESDQQQPAAH